MLSSRPVFLCVFVCVCGCVFACIHPRLDNLASSFARLTWVKLGPINSSHPPSLSSLYPELLTLTFMFTVQS